jgi:hypothetical protein
MHTWTITLQFAERRGESTKAFRMASSNEAKASRSDELLNVTARVLGPNDTKTVFSTALNVGSIRLASIRILAQRNETANNLNIVLKSTCFLRMRKAVNQLPHPLAGY